MPGLPNRASASLNASTQNPAVSVFDSRQDSTRRVAQSMIATRYKNPCCIGMYVTSAAHTWFGWSIVLPRRRYGYTLCSGCRLLVFRFGLTAHSPSFFISRRTRRRLVATRKQLARTRHQLLLPSADHRRMNPKFCRQLSQGLLPRKRRHRHSRLEFCAVLLPLYAHVSRPFGPVSL